jgi:hypothetical protein
MKKIKKKLSPNGENFHLNNLGRKIGQTDTEYIRNLVDSIKRLESAIQSLNVHQCPNCEEVISPHSKMLLGGICKECWANDPDMDDRIDFSTLTNREIGLAWWDIDLYDAMICHEHRKQDEFTILYASAIEAYLGYDRILESVQSVRNFKGKPIEAITSTNNIRWEKGKYFFKQ